MNFERYRTYMDPRYCYGFAVVFNGYQIQETYTLDQSEFLSLCCSTPFKQLPSDLDDYLKVVVYYSGHGGHYMEYKGKRKEYIVNPKETGLAKYEYSMNSVNLNLTSLSLHLEHEFSNTFMTKYVAKFVKEHLSEFDYETDQPEDYREFHIESNDNMERYTFLD